MRGVVAPRRAPRPTPPPGASGGPARLRWIASGAIAIAVVTTSALLAPRLRYGEPVHAPEWVADVRVGRLDSATCISCHEEAGAAWSGSLHQHANRELSHATPGASFLGQTVSTHAAEYTFVHAGSGRGPVIREQRRDGTTLDHSPSMMIGYGTLRQFLIRDASGRFQSTEVAWDPHRLEWFGVFGMEERTPGDWGHWTGQSMNWNSMCARCHMTAYVKGYDEVTDTYRSTWTEQGIGCIRCHGPMTGHESGGRAMQRVDNISRDRPRMMQTCAACHARAEDLTRSMPPGEAFDDHFRLQLMADPTYYADGQIRDEDFEWGSFRHSRMHTAGVTCLDCHNAHTGKLRLPAQDNSLCMQCHAEGNERKAPPISPTAHSFHKPESQGNRCVECHMRETTYMQRDPRRDHGFIIPDPLLHKELGIPDSCTKCHADKSVDWNIEVWEKWYGPSGKAAPRRARTRAVARAFAGDAGVVPELLRLIDEEKVPGWRASLLDLARGLDPDGAAVAPMAMRLRSDPDTLIRAAAVRALGQNGARFRPQLQVALKDPSRLVRLDAAWPLSPELAAGSPERRELDDYLDVFIDSPVSLMRRGQDRFRRGRAAEAIADLQRAIRLDPLSAPLPETLGFILDDSGRPAEAAAQFERAAELAPASAGPPYFAALAWAAAGDLAKAEQHLRNTVGRDPSHSRAWYNLGLLLNQTGRTAEALDALAKGERQGATDPDIPYAAATILLQAGRRDEAVAAARRALAIEPRHEAAAGLLRQLSSAR